VGSPIEISRELRDLADETFRLDQRTCELQVIRETLDETIIALVGSESSARVV
jgi:hypothetical protein